MRNTDTPIIRLPFILLFVGFVLCYIVWAPQRFSVEQMSMFPTIANGDIVWTYQNTFINDIDIERGDIIVFLGAKNNLVKRVIGLPGDIVSCIDGQMALNGKPLYEPYVLFANEAHENFREEVPEDCYFVMGDNRPYSYDSRHFGPINQTRVIGKVFWK